jgi:exodeoxyribonuclease V beta subunit
MQPFDLIASPLVGTNLIEASAGTGKTYTIAGLFVRLIMEKGLDVDQILVVTFTKAATAELKDRIYQNLYAVRRAMEKGHSDDPLIKALMAQAGRSQKALDHIRNALLGFDRAAVFTIHGFCQRVLQQGAFETDSLFNATLLANPTELVQAASDDFWRRHVYKEPPEFVQYLLRKARGPEYFSRLLMARKFPDIQVVPALKACKLDALADYRKFRQEIRLAWPNAREAVKACLGDQGLNSQSYGNQKKITPSGLNGREAKIASLFEQMQLLLNPNGLGFPLFKDFEKFTSSYIAAKTKKKHLPPNHPFFDLCEKLWVSAGQLDAQMTQRFILLKSKLFGFAEQFLERKKKQDGVQFFDDLLLKVRGALKKPASTLKQSLRRKYRVAMIDEFQDTDPIQYEIFSLLFDCDPNLLFFIGDPKQAIYGFRGADIFAYIRAAQKALLKYTLTTNWRSTPSLVAAVSTIFSNVDTPFLFEEIGFEEGRAGLKANAEQDKTPPLKLWYLPAQDEKPWTKGNAVDHIAGAVAAEITGIAHPDTGYCDPADIAVLVRTNRQARIVKRHLALRQVPAVLYSLENVFDSPEARMLELVLEAVIDPGNEGRLKGALSCDLLGWRDADLLRPHTDPDAWERILERFFNYGSIWRQYGFMSMFGRLLIQEDIRRRLLRLPEGERRLTNLLQLGEILQQAAISHQLSSKKLLKWFVRQCHPDTLRQEEHQLRLESDANAVKIVTIHRSKGLQYPIVFCPFAWEGANANYENLLFHDDDKERTLTLDIGSVDFDHHKVLAANEYLAENLRLLYVALTRACERAYLVWGDIRGNETSAMAYLFHGTQNEKQMDSIVCLKQTMASKSPSDIQSDLHRLVKHSNGCIELAQLPYDKSSALFPKAAASDANLSHRKFGGRVRRGWSVVSYSGLAQGGISHDFDKNELPDRDDLPDHDYSIDETGAAPEIDVKPPEAKKESILDFPRGAHAGTFMHDLLEQVDFESCPGPLQSVLIKEKLSAHGYENRWHESVAAMLDNVLNVALPGYETAFVLSSISENHRQCEVPFYYPIREVTPQTLCDAFRTDTDLGAWVNNIGRLTFSPSQGFMRGFIDLVFQHQGRYYLLDWKSNYLGARSENYRQSALEKAMQTHLYHLQYHLYILALHRHLGQRLPGYGYENHFGGVFYLFLRGLDKAKGAEYGVYYDRPAPGLVYNLERAILLQDPV